MARKIVTNEEKIAAKILDLFNDVTIDPTMVGLYISQIAHHELYSKLNTAIEEARSRRPIIVGNTELDGTEEEETYGTDFETRCGILGELYINEKGNETYEEFIEQNDLGLPLGYLISSGIVESTPKAEGFINDTFDALLAAYGLEDGEEELYGLDDLTQNHDFIYDRNDMPDDDEEDEN